MALLRSVLIKHPVLALAIGLAALALRLAVPAGFMPALDHGRVALMLCPGSGPTMAAAPSSGAGESMPGMPHHEQDGAQVQASCAFADLSLSMLGGGGPLALAAAIAFFIFAGLFLSAAPPSRPALRLRPPLRGPPLPR